MPPFKSVLIALLAALVVVLAAIDWSQSRDLAALRADSNGKAERAELRHRLRAAQTRIEALRHDLASTRAERPGTAGRRAERPDLIGPVAARSGPSMVKLASLLNRPAAQRLLALQQKAQVDARYGALFEELGLPSDKLARLKSLLGDRLSTPIDALAVASQQGISPVDDSQAFRQLVAGAQSQIDNKIQTLLDPAEYAQYQNYLQTEPQRAVVNQLQQALSYTDAPLTPEQANQMVQILAATSPTPAGSPAGRVGVAYVNAKGTDGGTFVSVGIPPAGGFAGVGDIPITNETISRASGVLSDPQLHALEQIQQQQQAALQLRQQILQNAASSGPPAPSPGG